jgi:hypothetical protein
MSNISQESKERVQEKFVRMIKRIYALERENSKTGAKTDKKMREEIIKIIEEEAKKCY